MATSNAATNNLEEAILTGILDRANDALYVSDLKIHLYGGTVPTASEIEAGTIGTEITTAGGYDRAGTALDTNNMEVTAAGVLQNDAEITWGAASADWSAPVTYIVIKGKLSSGGSAEPLFIGELDDEKTVSNGDTFKFAANALSITLA
jgi:hypothetical protein